MVNLTALQNLTRFDRIVKDDGTPSELFMRIIQGANGVTADLDTEVTTLGVAVAAAQADIVDIQAVDIVAGVALSGGGNISGPGDVTLDHEDSVVAPGTYGDGTNIPQITVNAQGHVTEVVDIPFSVGSSAYRPMVDGSVPPNLMYEADGSLIMEVFTP